MGFINLVVRITCSDVPKECRLLTTCTEWQNFYIATSGYCSDG